MHAGNVFSLVKRTLFEANSDARRVGKASLTSAQTSRLLPATPHTVNPAMPNIALQHQGDSHARNACKIVSRCNMRTEETIPLAAVTSPASMRERRIGANMIVATKGIKTMDEATNDNDGIRPVIIITGRVWRQKGGAAEGVHVMLVEPHDESAVRRGP